MNLIVHIGTPKTGTTTIQDMLFRNRHRLRSLGYHLLECAGQKNSRALAAYSVRDGRVDGYLRNQRVVTPEQKAVYREVVRDRLRQEITSLEEDVHTVIVSCEQLSSRLKSRKEIERFFDLVSPFFSHFKVLCWLREQSEMAVSRYSTSMRTGVTLSFREFLARCQPGNGHYDYYAMLNRWSAVFGEGQIRVRLFDKGAFHRGELASDFLCCISPDLVDALDKWGERKNVSINVVGLWILLMVNRLFRRFSDGWLKNRSSLRMRIVRWVEKYFSGPGFRLSLSDQRRIYDAFYESNRMLNEKYLKKSCALFSPPELRSR